MTRIKTQPDINALRRWGGAELRRRSCEDRDTAELDASLLLADTLGRERDYIYTHTDERVSSPVIHRYRRRIKMRMRGLPVAYLIGRREFFGRSFRVGRGVLIPRPETETLIERALALIEILRQDDETIRVHDSCSGSGAIALTLHLESPRLVVSASDISKSAARYFICNRRLLSCDDVRFYRSDLLARLPPTEQYHLITANPPYLRNEEYDQPRVRRWREPRRALRAGIDGLDCIRRLIVGAPSCLAAGGYLLCEAAPAQMDAIKTLLSRSAFGDIRLHCDLNGDERIIEGRWEGQ